MELKIQAKKYILTESKADPSQQSSATQMHVPFFFFFFFFFFVFMLSVGLYPLQMIHTAFSSPAKSIHSTLLFMQSMCVFMKLAGGLVMNDWAVY